MATPLTIHHLQEVGSTQHEARVLCESPGGVPLLLVADRQASGRGRDGHSWLTAPRALACSLAVAPAWRTPDWSTIPLLAGLAARNVLREKSGVETGLKWPNDLMVEAGKVGGILVEASGELVVVGLGVNLWWPDAPGGIAAIHEDDPGPDVAAVLAEAWAQRVLANLGREPRAWGLDEYRAACETLGKAVTWEPGGRGTAVDIASDGGLVVETPSGRLTLRSGEVHAVRTTTLAAEPPDTAGGTAE